MLSVLAMEMAIMVLIVNHTDSHGNMTGHGDSDNVEGEVNLSLIYRYSILVHDPYSID